MLMPGSILLRPHCRCQPGEVYVLRIFRDQRGMEKRWCADGTVAKARGDYVRTHFKNMREVAAAVSGEL